MFFLRNLQYKKKFENYQNMVECWVSSAKDEEISNCTYTKFALFYLLGFIIHVLKTRIFCLSLVGYITKCMYLKNQLCVKWRTKYIKEIQNKHVCLFLITYTLIFYTAMCRILKKCYSTLVSCRLLLCILFWYRL